MGAARHAGKVYVGTSGWTYKSWRGIFYPHGLPAKEWLGYYAAHFDTVEVNSSFYRLPRATVVKDWMDKVPEGFRICFKAWRGITHLHRLKNADKAVHAMMEVLGQAHAVAGPLLLQLPPGLKRDEERLDAFLALMDRAAEGWMLAVEMRHPSWYTDDVRRMLEAHGATLVVHDMPVAANDMPTASGPVYLRYHGPKGDYGGSYGEKRLALDARRIKRWLAEGRDVYAFFNNDRDGFATANAQRLAALIRS
jgi:uncharacterized protein YecE (DUF72 family)